MGISWKLALVLGCILMVVAAFLFVIVMKLRDAGQEERLRKFKNAFNAILLVAVVIFGIMLFLVPKSA
ncbi:hypothetical protein BPY_15520 [Bifidobacterium psychraerophilum]|jgi:heme/copper-type cytochrome/quinol oxidase subunit 2|uniref:Uncharacterized protein n=1 Tax=Bifidobacterium psychraerophilum TaxID=218140 RepID=A0A087CGP3_9BIFI|nr:hypothetical protein [Bifidobacterium psychraerophilum]KFI82443.1 hypothetical protein BPSY_1294 [Bifidobacterium psychraerophilum]MCI1660300.1 hypothetical protein [Bifidobacterium psychraerophilum]MCI1805031.1 hypothetical protein [Bifidobacterium psychraerophilum]MCI2175632.1 hypothetical protein [Bifidobacterium psychraerophilum]MCI2182126.1 hypothetical protein [Bifidobacterium psychraerophilum]